MFSLGYLIGKLLRPLRLFLLSKISNQLDTRLERFMDWWENKKKELLVEQQLEDLAKRFDEWYKEYHPRLAREQALELYPGIEIGELLRGAVDFKEVRNGKR